MKKPKVVFQYGDWQIVEWNTRSRPFKVFYKTYKRVHSSSASMSGALFLVGAHVCAEHKYAFRSYDEWHDSISLRRKEK